MKDDRSRRSERVLSFANADALTASFPVGVSWQRDSVRLSDLVPQGFHQVELFAWARCPNLFKQVDGHLKLVERPHRKPRNEHP